MPCIAWARAEAQIGFCFFGAYITVESWLNASATNDTRGQAMSAYMIVQMLGIIPAQLLMNTADPAGYLLFVILGFGQLVLSPILLNPARAAILDHETDELRQAVPGLATGLRGDLPDWAASFRRCSGWPQLGPGPRPTVTEISAFVAAIYFGGLVLQYPIGWLSDHSDRRMIVLCLSVAGF